MATAVVIGDQLQAAPEITNWQLAETSAPHEASNGAPLDLVTEVIGITRGSDLPKVAPTVTMADDEEEGEEEEFESVETPDFEGLEDFDDEDFDDEFDDDFEEELEDEYDFDEFDERVTEEDLEAAEVELPLVGDFVDEDAEEEPAGPAVAEEEPGKEPEEKPKKGKKKPKEE